MNEHLPVRWYIRAKAFVGNFFMYIDAYGVLQSLNRFI